MSAQLDSLQAQLESVKQAIKTRESEGKPVSELREHEDQLTKQIAHARELLTEGTTKSLLKG